MYILKCSLYSEVLIRQLVHYLFRSSCTGCDQSCRRLMFLAPGMFWPDGGSCMRRSPEPGRGHGVADGGAVHAGPRAANHQECAPRQHRGPLHVDVHPGCGCKQLVPRLHPSAVCSHRVWPSAGFEVHQYMFLWSMGLRCTSSPPCQCTLLAPLWGQRKVAEICFSSL